MTEEEKYWKDHKKYTKIAARRCPTCIHSVYRKNELWCYHWTHRTRLLTWGTEWAAWCQDYVKDENNMKREVVEIIRETKRR